MILGISVADLFLYHPMFKLKAKVFFMNSATLIHELGVSIIISC